jgi:hypothetical protein
MDFPVRYFHSQQRGAPKLSGTAGSLIALLDALLVNGFGMVTAQSVTVSGGIATATLPLGQSFEARSVILIAGAPPAALNGQARVLPGASDTQVQWATAAADGVATGSITIKVAPAPSWSKVYAGANLGVYKSSDLQANGHFLRVADTNALFARVIGYTSMTDVSTGTGPFPTSAQISGGGYWHKSIVSGATAVRWKLFADSRALLIAIANNSINDETLLSAPLNGFGDPLALRPAGDAWGTFISAAAQDANMQFCRLDISYVNYDTTNGFIAAPRAWNGLGTAVLLNLRAFVGNGSVVSGNDSALGAFPSSVDGRMMLSRVYFTETNQTTPRAVVPGVLRIAQTDAVALISDGDVIVGSGDLAGRVLVAVASGFYSSSPPDGVYLVDVTGPWR